MIQRQERGDVAVLALEHHKANALDLELLEALEAELARAEGDGTRALVLTGRGSIFSAGVNLFRVLDGGREYLERFLPALDGAARRLFTFPRPVVAAINGHAMAGGWVLACACDVRVMADGYGKIGLPELRVGVPFPALLLEVVRAATPSHLLEELILGGRTFTGAEAAVRGLVGEAVEPGVVVERAVERAEELARLAADAYAMTKARLRRPYLEQGRSSDAERAAVLEAWAAPATLETIRGYLEGALGKGG